ncbi:adaptin N terminal region-domain-containing protein [Scheffersomyces coipomensis]|uniref:adaptin N terminal region-domain-containing protein n=1 Tax=Scheffersomyces coipomensis TaxID=1788519 RepID=UPI00315DBAFE
MASFQLQNSEVLARLKPFGISFEKSLSDLIKGIRSHSKESPESLSSFLDVAIQECKNELTTTDLETKAMAVLKLSYLEMYGFDMSWCNFQILEVMSSSKFQQKRIGYLAAIQSFKNEQDLLILTTNQFKKDLNSHNHVEIGLALSGIATIVTPNLSKDINDDVIMKLNHSKPYIRKKAILAMYKIFLQFPESLRANFNRIIEKLDDTDVSVVSATLNVICEISKKNPNIFINYLPKFFSILEETKNNWLIIRILKLFQSLSKVEPRMKKKILPTIIDLMLRTQASSLIYECINCIVNGQMLSPESFKDKETAKLCIKQIMEFFKTKDSNLKFVGLIALINVLKIFPIFIHQVEGVAEVVTDCINDPDLIIKRKSLEICHFLVTEDNIVEVVKILLVQLIPTDGNQVPESLKQEVMLKILAIASQDNYSNIPNFKWYIAVLKDIINLTLLPLPSSSNTSAISYATANFIAGEVGQEFKNLATKVPSIRADILHRVIVDSVKNPRVLEICPTLLKDFYWIMGEYIDELKGDPVDSENNEIEEGDSNTSIADLGKKVQIFNTLVNHKIDKSLNLSVNLRFPISNKLINLNDHDVLMVLIQALVKLFSGIVSDYSEYYSKNGALPIDKYNEVAHFLYKLVEFLNNWENSVNYEVQERALSWLEFLKLSLEAMTDNDYSAIKALESDEIEFYRNFVDDSNENEDSDIDESDDEEVEDSESEDEVDSVPENIREHDEEYDSLESSSDEVESEVLARVNVSDNGIEENPFATNEEEPTFFSETNSKELVLPVLLSHVLPSFFKSYQLNPIAKNSQRKIAVPLDLDLDTPINSNNYSSLDETEEETESEYNLFLADQLEIIQTSTENISNEGDTSVRKKQERLERLKDDPYYLTSTNGDKKGKGRGRKSLLIDDSKDSSVDTFSERTSISSSLNNQTIKKKKKPLKIKKDKVVILAEETIGGDFDNEEELKVKATTKKRNALKIDSSNLDNFDLESSSLAEDDSTFNGKDFEYNIDLEELRKNLAEASKKAKEKEEKKKKMKKKLSSSKESTSKTKSKTKTESSDVGHFPTADDIVVDSNLPESDNKVVTVVKSKKTKKKAKAAIIE